MSKAAPLTASRNTQTPPPWIADGAPSASRHTLIHVPLATLRISACNVRRHKPKAIASLAASIARRGLIQSLLVRNTDGTTGYEIIAGQRRYHALKKLDVEGHPLGDIPCMLLADTTDAAAIAASLDENTERQAMDPIDLYDTIRSLIQTGIAEPEIAFQLGISQPTVARHLAIANLSKAIKQLYQNGDIDDDELHLLTLATRAQQADYAARRKKGNQPASWQLRRWITGSEMDLRVDHAVFSRDAYTGTITSDLFQEVELFADHEQFWTLQHAAVEHRRAHYVDAGWTSVIVFTPSDQYRAWAYKSGKKAKGAEVHIVIAADGKVTEHTGRLPINTNVATRKPTTPAEPGSAAPAKRSELTAGQARYVDAIRYSAVRAALAASPQKAFRWLIAHLIAGRSDHLKVTRCHPRCDTPEEGIAVEAQAASKSFAAQVEITAKRLSLSATDSLTGNATASSHETIASVYRELSSMPDSAVLAIAALLMGETLTSGSRLIDAIGVDLALAPAIDAPTASHLITSLRSADLLDSIVEDVTSKSKAKSLATASSTQKRAAIQKALIARETPWVARWLQFPQQAYTAAPISGLTKPSA